MIEKILTLILAFVILFLVIELIRQEKLTFKYAFGWMVVSFLTILLTIFDGILLNIAQFFGFSMMSDFIHFIVLGVLVWITLLMTIFLCQQNSHNDTIAQKIGTLEFEIECLKKKLFQNDKIPDGSKDKDG